MEKLLTFEFNNQLREVELIINRMGAEHLISILDNFINNKIKNHARLATKEYGDNNGLSSEKQNLSKFVDLINVVIIHYYTIKDKDCIIEKLLTFEFNNLNREIEININEIGAKYLKDILRIMISNDHNWHDHLFTPEYGGEELTSIKQHANNLIELVNMVTVRYYDEEC